MTENKVSDLIHFTKVGRWSSILNASENGDIDIVKLLLSTGANIHDKDNDNRSCLYAATSQ